MSVVVGFIPTPEGHAALDRAMDEARLRDAPLVVVHVSRGSGQDADPAVGEELTARLADSGIDYELLRPAGDNDAAAEILQAAEDHDAALLVIGIRHRTPVGKLIMASTAQRILIEARCAVLSVKSAT